MNSVTKVWTHQLLAATWTIWECAMPCCKLSEAIARLPFIALGSTRITKGWENTIFQNYAVYFCFFGPWIWGRWGVGGMKPFAWFDALFARCFLFGLAWAMHIAHHCTMFARADRSFLFIIGVRVNILINCVDIGLHHTWLQLPETNGTKTLLISALGRGLSF